jgi:hypothetical protein
LFGIKWKGKGTGEITKNNNNNKKKASYKTAEELAVKNYCPNIYTVHTYIAWERGHLVVLVKVIMSEMRADLSLPINFYDHYARIAETSSLIDRK